MKKILIENKEVSSKKHSIMAVNISLGHFIFLKITFCIYILFYIFVQLYIWSPRWSLLQFNNDQYDYGSAYDHHQIHRYEVRDVFVVRFFLLLQIVPFLGNIWLLPYLKVRKVYFVQSLFLKGQVHSFWICTRRNTPKNIPRFHSIKTIDSQ